MQAKSLTVWETREIHQPVISMRLWQMSVFARAAGGMVSLLRWNPDETAVELLVMKSGHPTNLLPQMTFNLHTCWVFCHAATQNCTNILCCYSKHISRELTKNPGENTAFTSSITTYLNQKKICISWPLQLGVAPAHIKLFHQSVVPVSHLACGVIWDAITIQSIFITSDLTARPGPQLFDIDLADSL